MESLWITGAFVTSLLYSGLLVLLFFLYLRLRSTPILLLLVSATGSLTKLVGELSLSIPELRFAGYGNPIGCGLLIGSGIGLVTYGIPSLAVALTAEYGRNRMKPAIAGYASLAGVLMLVGVLAPIPRLAAAAYFLEYAAGLAAGILVLAKAAEIRDRHIRLLSRIVSGSSIALLPFCILQKLLPFGHSGPFGAEARPYPQALLLLLAATATLLFGFRYLARTARTHRETLDTEATRGFAITLREREIIILIAEGDSNEEIASRLFISESTVKNHIYNIYRKLNVHNRVELLNAVMRRN